MEINFFDKVLQVVSKTFNQCYPGGKVFECNIKKILLTRNKFNTD